MRSHLYLDSNAPMKQLHQGLQNPRDALVCTEYYFRLPPGQTTLVRLEISHVKKSYFSPHINHPSSSLALAPITLLNKQKLPSNGPEGQ